MEKKEIYETAEKICNHFTKLDEKKYPRVDLSQIQLSIM